MRCCSQRSRQQTGSWDTGPPPSLLFFDSKPLSLSGGLVRDAGQGHWFRSGGRDGDRANGQGHWFRDGGRAGSGCFPRTAVPPPVPPSPHQPGQHQPSRDVLRRPVLAHVQLVPVAGIPSQSPQGTMRQEPVDVCPLRTPPRPNKHHESASAAVVKLALRQCFVHANRLAWKQQEPFWNTRQQVFSCPGSWTGLNPRRGFV